MISIPTLNKRKLSNGHVIVSYKLGDSIVHDEYTSQADADAGNQDNLVSKAYAQKDENGNNTLVYVNPQKTSQILKTITYDANNKPSEEIHFDTNQRQTLLRYYYNGILNQDWLLNPQTGQIKTGYQYKKNEQGRYDIISVSKPVYAPNGELSHTIQTKSTPNGKSTGEILQRVFYLCNLPFVRATYTKNPQNPEEPLMTISSLEDGQWEPVTDKILEKHLTSIFDKAISLENKPQERTSVLAKNSNLNFQELYLEDVTEFKKSNPSLQIIPLSDIEEIPDDEEKQSMLKNLSDEELKFVNLANNAGYFISFIPQKANQEFLFAPSEAQYKNAVKSREKEAKNTDKLSYLDILNAKENFWGFGIISKEESKKVPLLPSLRQNFFETLSSEEQTFVLKANLAGHNVALKGDNGLAFLYMAPQTEIARTRMKTELKRLTTEPENTLSTNAKETVSHTETTPEIHHSKQYS